MNGKRVPDVEDPTVPHPMLNPGEYRKSEGIWECRPPGDHPPSLQGNLSGHEVVEHEDGTITVSPSILCKSTWAGEPVEWHGYLERGVWREV